MTYVLLDSGDGEKLERFGVYSLIRPCPQALWRKQHPSLWKEADARFSREQAQGWHMRRPLPFTWTISLEGVILKVEPTDFGHLGLFPEHASHWGWMRRHLSPTDRVLHLFAYAGGATLAAAQAGASVCHVDAARGMVEWAKENRALNGLVQAPIRWIVEDVLKFLKREEKRASRYDAIVLDPPTFGRGAQGEVFKIEEAMQPLLELTESLLTPQPKFVLLTCHTPGLTPIALEHLLEQRLARRAPVLESGEMCLESPGALSIPSGAFVRARFSS